MLRLTWLESQTEFSRAAMMSRRNDVRRRYQRSFENLPIALERADHTILFDNSTEEGYRLIAVLGPSGNQWFEPIPGWVKANQS
jgi:predicted ABC-type ATPase